MERFINVNIPLNVTINCLRFQYKMGKSRNDCERKARVWGQNKCISHVANAHTFKDGQFFYRFDIDTIMRKSVEAQHKKIKEINGININNNRHGRNRNSLKNKNNKKKRKV